MFRNAGIDRASRYEAPRPLALRRRIPPARQPAEAFRLPGAVVAGARFEHSRQTAAPEDRPLAFLFILPRLKSV